MRPRTGSSRTGPSFSPLESADSASVSYYSELLEIGLGDSPARATWRDMMSVGTYFPGRGTIVEESYLEGKTDGILQILEQRGIPIGAEARERITGCTDLDTINRWFNRAITVDNEQDLFAADDAG